MKLINVEYLEESKTAMFFNFTIESVNMFGKPKNITRRAYFVKPHKDLGLRFVNDFYWADTNSYCGYSQAHIVQEMILQYQKSNPIHIESEIIEAYNFGELAGESAGSGNAIQYLKSLNLKL